MKTCVQCHQKMTNDDVYQEHKTHYNGRKIEDWIQWAENEIAEYKLFIKFLKGEK